MLHNQEIIDDLRNLKFASKYGFERQVSGGDKRYPIYWSPGKKCLIRVDTQKSIVSTTKNVDPDTLTGTDEKLHQRFKLREDEQFIEFLDQIDFK